MAKCLLNVISLENQLLRNAKCWGASVILPITSYGQLKLELQRNLVIHWGSIKMRSLFYDMVYDGRRSNSDPFCSSLEVGMLSDKVVRTSFFASLCCRGPTGISCRWGGSPGCFLTGCLLKSCHCRDKREQDSLVKSFEWEAVGPIPLLNVPAFLLFVFISVVSKMQNQDSCSSALNTMWQIRLYFDPCIPDCMMLQFLKEGSALWLCSLGKKSNC